MHLSCLLWSWVAVQPYVFLFFHKYNNIVSYQSDFIHHCLREVVVYFFYPAKIQGEEILPSSLFEFQLTQTYYNHFPRNCLKGCCGPVQASPSTIFLLYIIYKISGLLYIPFPEQQKIYNRFFISLPAWNVISLHPENINQNILQWQQPRKQQLRRQQQLKRL